MSLAGSQTETTLRILVATSSGLVPEQLEGLLEAEGMSAQVRKPILRDAAVSAEPADVVVFGDRDRSVSLAALAVRTRHIFRDAAIVAVVSAPESINARILLEVGTDAVVLAADAGRALGPAIRAVSMGQLSVPRRMWRASAPARLSARERETMAMALAGLTNAEIAARMSIAEATARRHLVSAFRRLAVHSRGEAATALLGNIAVEGRRSTRRFARSA